MYQPITLDTRKFCVTAKIQKTISAYIGGVVQVFNTEYLITLNRSHFKRKTMLIFFVTETFFIHKVSNCQC